MGRPSTKIEVNCVWCGGAFFTIPFYQKTGRGKYCRQACYNAARVGVKRDSYNWNKGTREPRTCLVCDAAFEVGFGTGRTLKQVYCSVNCQRAGRYRTSQPANELTPVQAAYLAGMIDGEGSIMLVERDDRDGIHLRVAVANTCKSMLEWILSVTGIGNIYTMREVGERHKASFSWRCHAEGAATLLAQLRPYLLIKTVQADLALEAHRRLKTPKLKADTTWQQEFRDQMKALNKRGPTEFLAINE